MKYVLYIVACLFFWSCKTNAQYGEVPESIYDFQVAGLLGDTINLADFKGKKLLIVNTASKCGNTPQYEDLEKLYNQYKDRLVILGFPANNFLRQEPGSNEEIAEFCQTTYGVTFPMAAKISVKGNDMAPIYQWLTQKKFNQFKDSKVKWNFQKYLIDEDGKLIAIFDPKTPPMSPEIMQALGF
jgi:glutathione peroxidase